jgi:hypothetical protein
MTLLPVVLAACAVAAPSAQAVAPARCLEVAREDAGSVSAFFTSTVGAVRSLPAVQNNPQLARYAAAQAATLCYIDGQIPKAPPPQPSATLSPPFNRAVVVVVGDDVIFAAAGYQANLAIERPEPS